MARVQVMQLFGAPDSDDSELERHLAGAARNSDSDASDRPGGGEVTAREIISDGAGVVARPCWLPRLRLQVLATKFRVRVRRGAGGPPAGHVVQVTVMA